MTIQEIIILIIIGAIAGWLGSLVIKNGFSSLITIVVGIVGSLLGTWLITKVLKISLTGVVFFNSNGWYLGLDQIICAFIGALIVLVVLKLAKKSK